MSNPVRLVDADGRFPWPFGKTKTAKRRRNPKTGSNIRGTGLVVLLGGTRGKFFRHNSLHKNKTPTPQPADNDLVTIQTPPDKDKTGTPKEPDNSNPLDRDSRSGEDQIINNRIDFIPKFNEGEFNITFEPELDEKGNPKSATIQIGKIDKDGNEIILQQTTTDKSGSLKAGFKLEEGERLFQRTINTGGSTTGATKKHEEQ